MTNKPITEWTDRDYLRRAYINARDMSDDPSTQNGSVLVPAGYPEHNLVYGANKLPRGIKIPLEVIATWPKEKKYRWMCHAEVVVIDLAALCGVSTFGATLIVPWFACMPCGRSIIEAGISRVVGHKQMRDKLHPTWMDEIEEADAMLDAAGVQRHYIDADLFDSDPAYAVLFRDELWIP
jgi:deoxycytidylate deaminase